MKTVESTLRLGDWFREWHAPLRKFLQRRHSVRAADVEDVAQEVFLRLLRYDRAELVQHPQAYLFKMASNVAAEWAMRAHQRQPHNAQWLCDLPSDESPEREAAQAASCAALNRALNALPARRRELLRLQFGDGLSHREIAQRLSLTERVVKRDLIKAYSELRMGLDIGILETWYVGSDDG
ncbi:MAG: polymerase sigma-70 factor, subfamily [Gammaproteobacteria bacterium]|nr:polymerase sigma-70 factor, subfamily [Gammaproteobacteria bacterium]